MMLRVKLMVFRQNTCCAVVDHKPLLVWVTEEQPTRAQVLLISASMLCWSSMIPCHG